MLPLEGRSQAIFVVTTVFLGLSFVAVCLRCFVRLRLVRAFGWDDGLMVSAMVISPDDHSHVAFTNTQLGPEHSVRPMWDHWCSIRNGSKVHGANRAGDNGNRHVCTFSTTDQPCGAITNL